MFLPKYTKGMSPTADGSAQIPCVTIGEGSVSILVIPGASIRREMASLIPNSEIILYPGYGHGSDQENPDYQRQVDRFIHTVEESWKKQ